MPPSSRMIEIVLSGPLGFPPPIHTSHFHPRRTFSENGAAGWVSVCLSSFSYLFHLILSPDTALIMLLPSTQIPNSPHTKPVRTTFPVSSFTPPAPQHTFCLRLTRTYCSPKARGMDGGVWGFAGPSCAPPTRKSHSCFTPSLCGRLGCRPQVCRQSQSSLPGPPLFPAQVSVSTFTTEARISFHHKCLLPICLLRWKVNLLRSGVISHVSLNS